MELVFVNQVTGFKVRASLEKCWYSLRQHFKNSMRAATILAYSSIQIFKLGTDFTLVSQLAFLPRLYSM